MARTDFSQMQCSIARTLEVIGERWSLLIVRDAMYGVRRFDDFQAEPRPAVRSWDKRRYRLRS